MLVGVNKIAIGFLDVGIQSPASRQAPDLDSTSVVIGSRILSTECTNPWVIENRLLWRFLEAPEKAKDVGPILRNLVRRSVTQNNYILAQVLRPLVKSSIGRLASRVLIRSTDSREFEVVQSAMLELF